MHYQQLPLDLPLRFRRKRSTHFRYPERHYWISIDPDRNRYRFYGLSVEEDLWGHVSLVLSYGRIHTKPKHRYIWVEDPRELDSWIVSISQIRERREYLLAEY